MKKRLSMFGLLLLMLCSMTAFAVSDNAIYQAEVPVHSQSVEERNAALAPALMQVLVKVTGSNSVLDNPNIKELLKDPGALVQEYDYSKPEGANESGYTLQVQFDHDGISQLLRKAQAPTWGAERPLLLVWADWEVPNQPTEIIDSASSNPFRTLLNKTAEKRGIPLVFPQMDLADINLVSVNDIVTMAIPTLKTAAKHYKSDGMLIIRGFQVGSGCDIQAQLVWGNEQLSFNLHDATLEGVLNTLVTQISDALAKRYSTVVSQQVQSNVTMKVVGITQREDFEQVKLYLKSLALVADVDPVEVSGQEVVLSLNVRGSREALMQSISAETKLVSVPDSAAGNLVYKWNP